MLAVALRATLAPAESINAFDAALAKLFAKVAVPHAFAVLIAWLARMIARVVVVDFALRVAFVQIRRLQAVVGLRRFLTSFAVFDRFPGG